MLLDHAEKDGLDGFTTITGGKLMISRLMAEMATDLVAKKIEYVTRFLLKEITNGRGPKMKLLNKKIVYHTLYHF